MTKKKPAVKAALEVDARFEPIIAAFARNGRVTSGKMMARNHHESSSPKRPITS